MPWVVFAASFAVYALGASPALGWYDSPEFVAAAVGLGVPHSPGHPLPVALGAAARLVPFGDLTLRVNLASALAGAAAASALALAGRALLARVAADVPPRARDAMSGAAALVLASSHALWLQAVRAEVYALTAALVIAMIGGTLAWATERRARGLVLAGLAGGLALSTHHLIAVMALVPAGVFALARRRGERPPVGAAAATALAGIVGLAAFLYLPVRSSAEPELDWGAPHTASAFVWTVSGAAFADNAGGGHASTPLVDLAQTVEAIGRAASLPLSLFGLLGLVVLLGQRGRRSTGLFLAGLVLLGAVGRAVFGFDPDTPDDHGYIVPAAAALVLLALAGAGALASAARERARGAALALAAAGVLFAAVRTASAWSTAAQPHADVADRLAQAELERLPPNAVLVASYYQTGFRALAMQAVEDTRPDVTVLHRGLLTFPGAQAAAERRHPELALLLRAPLAADAPTPIAELEQVASRRPVWFELDPSLDAPAHQHLQSLGRFARFSPVLPAAAEADVVERADAGAARRDLDRLLERARASERLELERAILWLDFGRLDHYCHLGRRAAAQEALDRAWELFPEDVMLEEQAVRCGLSVPR